ncbi:Inner membrane transport protein ynfM (plasmid) [Tsukamurella tyrosinosolvens]|uniref:Predicted arabinose efflux permease, MFS family n=1 Tax=Tsukamurella tyrosinosolvens TaxID=57704 RepID=A0A1H4I5X1_TSUTY|nr:MFS transporter [Tsukamurella tyrosinosolvens]KXO92739.1 MFS transporter [Tsukamurella tyrosinosolvens]SEB29321.1 Predicted arabinose efflux permease, MFS family [Tsukamurella tyrosinosolvens]SED64141.1 Predicted arabinose efflux permease, MFS family [Tsukamurella tyrosinosolvens]VEH95976.1 Inner membrane transport protein ynfM [Tsukamurella tyrosinosolvens]
MTSATVLFMSVAAALGTATIYPLQPAIADVAASFGTGIGAVGVALSCGPVGYMLGLALLVPLVDRFPPRSVLALQFAALAVALAATVVAPSAAVLGVVLLVTGACSSVGAGLSSLVGRLAPVGRRSTDLGIVTAGISAGILIGRIAGGWLSDEIGWRAMLLTAAAACAIVAVVSAAILPAERGLVTQSYISGLWSMPGLLRRSATLRGAAFRGALWFFAFCAVWSGLAVALSQPPRSLSAERIGLYALAGLAGIVATRIAGRWTDRVGARPVILAGLVLAAAACVALAVGLNDAVVTLIALAAFDAGLFAAQVANQSTVLDIDPAAPARYNGVYMLVYFVGGSAGAAFGASAAAAVGWGWVTGACIVAIGLAAVLTGPDAGSRPTRDSGAI